MNNSQSGTHAMAGIGHDRTFDVLTSDIRSIQTLLQSGAMCSTQLVEAYVAQIHRHDNYLHAMICTAPKASLHEIATGLDEERQKGNSRGPLHGIPIVIKDNTATHPDLGMKTSAGSFALLESRVSKNARIVDKLIEAGAIIIGKANLSELSNYKGKNMPSGWSAVGGQGQSAYVRGGLDPQDDSSNGHSNTSGSSSGSAVAVSAGYAPISIGTETDGSLVCPAGRAALYTIKPTPGLASVEGIVPVSHTFDAPGPMTKAVYDLAVVLDILVETHPDGVSSYTSALTGSWSDIGVAAMDPEVERWDEDTLKPVEEATVQMDTEIRSAYAKIKCLAKTFAEDVPLIPYEDFIWNAVNSEETVMRVDFKKDINKYLSKLESSPVRTLQELIDFNKTHADKELPPGYDNQDRLKFSRQLYISDHSYDLYVDWMRRTARDRGIDHILNTYGVDIIIGPIESKLMSFAAAAGYPIATLPLGYLDYNGRPFGLCCVARANEEALLIKVQSAWEATFEARRPPPALIPTAG